MNKYLISLSLILLTLASLLYKESSFPQVAPLKDNHYETFQKWRSEYSIETANQQEYQYRARVFSENLHKIHTHNQLQNRTYDMGLNQFAHLTENEFTIMFAGHSLRKNLQTEATQKTIRDSDQSLSLEPPIQVDWQVLGKVSEIKNQGNCDAGYAFSATSLMQSSLLMQNENTLLSQQQIIDCSGDYETFGCNGGSRKGTLEYVKHKGLQSQEKYPYTGDKGYCRAFGNPDFELDFDVLESNGCDDLKNNIYESPIMVAVNTHSWQFYKTGIFNGCANIEANHDTFLVGVTANYWRLKNSWGTKWGEYGYIRLKIGNTCGICERVGYGFDSEQRDIEKYNV